MNQLRVISTDRTTRLYVVGNGQCVARTRKGRRCLNSAEPDWDYCGGGVESFIEVGPDQYVECGYYPDRVSPDFFDQHCHVHFGHDCVDYCGPEIELFNVVRHADHVQSGADVIARVVQRTLDSGSIVRDRGTLTGPAARCDHTAPVGAS